MVILREGICPGATAQLINALKEQNVKTGMEWLVAPQTLVGNAILTNIVLQPQGVPEGSIVNYYAVRVPRQRGT